MSEQQQPNLWTAPVALTDAELERMKLPGDIRVGDTMFRKGVSMLHLINQHRVLWRKLHREKGDLL